MNIQTRSVAVQARAPETVEAIAIIDLGGQYCHMIGRRLRDHNIRADVFPHTVSARELAKYSGIILSGGPQSVYDPAAPSIDSRILTLNIPLLGICYGHQLLAKLLGCKVVPCSQENGEYGKAQLKLRKADSLFFGTPEKQIVWMSHADSVEELATGLEPLAKTNGCAIAAFGDFKRKIFGVQFHPEVTHSLHGKTILDNFSRRICQIKKREKIKDRVARLLDDIRTRVGSRSVLFFVSGGVDSTVAFALCARALPRHQILGVYVDTGLMRKNETAELVTILERAKLGDRLKIRDESKRFLDALEGVSEPEDKRRIIGRLFVDVQREAMHEYGIDQDHWLLGQGTIYPDTVESGGHGGTTALIKTHHNRCEEIRELIARGKIIEPLSEFYKDEVREVGTELGLHVDLVERWPFPGPGLAIRVLCNDVERKPAQKDDLPAEFSGYEAAKIPTKTVGVQGDSRTYREVLAVRGRLDYRRLSRLSTTVCNSGKRYNRVIALVAGDISRLADGVVEIKPMDKKRVALLREADHIVKTIMQSSGYTRKVWQFPTILIPLSFAGGETVILRPVNSEDGMTANFSKLPVRIVRKIGKEISKLNGIDAVFLDVTDKPPATIEWE